MTRLYTNREKGILRKNGIRMANKKFTNPSEHNGNERGEAEKAGRGGYRIQEILR